MIEWVKTTLTQPQPPDISEPSKPLSVDDLVMPDIYVEVNATAKILDLNSPDSDKKRGFNPYDTGVLQKK